MQNVPPYTSYLTALLDGWGESNMEETVLLQQAKDWVDGKDKEAVFRPLYPIAATIGKGGEQFPFFSLQVLSLENTVVLPEDQAEIDTTNVLNRAAETRAILEANIASEALPYTLFQWLQRYGSRIAYSSRLKATVSAFDRNRILAGLTQCLSKTKGETSFILLRGGISGIQRFIYSDIKLEQVGNTKKLAQRLRGRSFYVSLLTDYIAEGLLDELGGEQAQLIYAGGGQFTMLLPYQKQTAATIKTYANHINQVLRQRVGHDLSVELVSKEYDEGLLTNFSSALAQLSEALEVAKGSKHKDYLKELFANADRTTIPTFKDDQDLGGLVPYANFMLEVRADKEEMLAILQENPALEACWVLRSLAETALFVFMVKADHLIEEIAALEEVAQRLSAVSQKIRLVRLNNTDFYEFPLKNINQPVEYGFRLVGSYAPISTANEVLSFEQLARIQYDQAAPLSYAHLATIRLDVDDLGAIFANGLPDQNLVSSASLSREFHLFFSGYFNTLAHQYRVYVTYSGGDDAFAIGSWYNILHFSRRLYRDFQKFTSQNSELSFSAGIFLCQPHYPIAKMASEAAELEERSKAYPNGGIFATKGAVTVFNHTLKWERFMDMLNYGELLHAFNEKGKNKGSISRSLVQRLLSIIHAGKRSETPMDFYQNVAKLHYLLSRQGYGKPQLERYKRKGSQMRDNGRTPDHPGMEVIPRLLKDFSDKKRMADYVVPMHYLLYKTRKNR